MKRNQKGVVDLMFVAVLVVLLAAGTFAFWQVQQTDETVSDTDSNIANQSSNPKAMNEGDSNDETHQNQPEVELKKYTTEVNNLSFTYPSDWKIVGSGPELGSLDTFSIQTSDFKQKSNERPGVAISGAKIIYTAQTSPEADSQNVKVGDEANYTASVKHVIDGVEHLFRIDTSSKESFDRANEVLDLMASSIL